MVVERRVTPVSVVEAFNEVEDRIFGFVVIPETCAVDQLALESGKEALAHRIVVAIADGSHGGTHSGLATSFAELNGCVLAALIGVMNDVSAG